MANQEHLDILKQGMEHWNQWRQHLNIERPDLCGADLNSADLRYVDFNGADLSEADLKGANLDRANLFGAKLIRTDLGFADFTHTTLFNANLSEALLIGVRIFDFYFEAAYLGEADLSDAIFTGGSFARANLQGADLTNAILQHIRLEDAIFKQAHLWWTAFIDVDLSLTKGLDEVDHQGPSHIALDTLYNSKGEIPETFLRGSGVLESFIAHTHSLVGKPIEYYKCFISYSSSDETFARRLYAELQAKGVRCWFAPENLKIGDKLRSRIDESIRLHDKLLIVLSEHSIASQWVEQEVETALERERKEQRTILFPIRLDKTVMDIEGGWPALIRNTRNIGDFTRWKRHDVYQKAFERLLRDLKAESKTDGENRM